MTTAGAGVCALGQKKKKTSKRGAHTRPVLSEVEKPNLACKVNESEEERTAESCSYYIIY